MFLSIYLFSLIHRLDVMSQLIRKISMLLFLDSIDLSDGHYARSKTLIILACVRCPDRPTRGGCLALIETRMAFQGLHF